MSSIINTNLGAINTQRSLSKSQTGLATALQRLSSGLRINSAKDDAAGIAIGDRMSAQINGQNVAIRNSNDGISLAQTAEGSMQQMTDLLQRVRELGVQAANGTNSRSDRKALSLEKDQLLAEVHRIGKTASFNGIKLLDGSFANQTFQIGANHKETLDVSMPNLVLGEITTQTPETITSSNQYSGLMPAGVRTLGLNGESINIKQTDSARMVAANINSISEITGVTATAATQVYIGDAVSYNIRIVAGENYGDAASLSFSLDGSSTSAKAAMDAINATSASSGVSAVDLTQTTGGAIFRLKSNSGENLHIINDSNSASTINFYHDTIPFNQFNHVQGTSGAGVFGEDDTSIFGKIELSSDKAITLAPDGFYDEFGDPWGFFQPDVVHIKKGTTEVFSTDISFATIEDASLAITQVDKELAKISSARAILGAIQNRFASIVTNLATSAENLSASRSRIMDADYAAETAALSKNQIFQQAATAMLVQANSIPQQALTLLKDL